MFVDHRANRTSRTRDSSERRQNFISVPLTIDKRKHYAIRIFPNNNGILFKQENSEILENIMKVGC